MESKKHTQSRSGSRRELGRVYPPKSERERILAAIEAIPDAQRSPGEWYTFGSLLVYEATIDEDDLQLNRGTDALVRAADAVVPEPEAFLELTWVLLYRGLDTLAVKYAIRATETQPAYRDTWTMRAWVHIGQGQRPEAISSLERAIVLPDSLPSDAELLRSLREGGDLTEIRKNLVLRHATVELLANTPGSEEEVARNLIFALRQELKLHPEDPVLLYGLAARYYQLKDYAQAEKYLGRLFAESSSHVDGLVLKALVRSKIGPEDEAVAWYNKALQVDPKHVLANTNRAVPLLRERRFREARPFVEAALNGKGEAEPRARAHDQMGEILCEEDHEYQKALRYHAEAVQLAPTNAQFQCNHLVSLIQADDMHGLRKYWGRYRGFLGRQTTSEVQRICHLVPAYLTALSDPRECVGLAGQLAPLLGWNAVKHFIREAWALVYRVPDDAKPGFCAEAGMMAGRADEHELALRFFTKGEAYDEFGGPLSLNCAVALSDLGRVDEAIAKARSCRTDQPRMLTVLGNILHRYSRDEEAVEVYLSAIEIDTDFFLPVENGMNAAIAIRRPDAIRRFMDVAQARWPKHIPARVLIGCGSAALGLYGDAAKEFLSVFAGPDGFCIPEVPSDGEVKPQQAEGEMEPVALDDDGTDLTLRGAFNPEKYLLMFAYALLHSGQVPVLQELVKWVSTQPALLNGDWKVLQGETFRLAGDHELALSQLEPLGTQLPAAATRALSHLDQGNSVPAREAAIVGLAANDVGKLFNHPIGDPRAICTAALGLADVLERKYDTALEQANRAIRYDDRCPIGWLVKAKALSSSGLEDDALLGAEEGLRHCPGDPDLYEWHQEKCLERGRLDSAVNLQEELREALLSRNKQTLFYALQARISEARFDEPATRVRMLIRAGEGTGLEFKSTLRWNVRAGKGDEEMTYACLKTIAAFLNTNGGTLLIGVADDGKVVGIEPDGFGNSDRFLQHLSNKILSALGEVAAADIASRIHELDGMSVCEVVCKSSKVPVYLRSKAEEEFYVRTGPRSDRLPPSKLVQYVRTRFTA